MPGEESREPVKSLLREVARGDLSTPTSSTSGTLALSAGPPSAPELDAFSAQRTKIMPDEAIGKETTLFDGPATANVV